MSRGGGLIAALMAIGVVIAILNRDRHRAGSARFLYSIGRDRVWGSPADRWISAVHPRRRLEDRLGRDSVTLPKRKGFVFLEKAAGPYRHPEILGRGDGRGRPSISCSTTAVEGGKNSNASNEFAKIRVRMRKSRLQR